MPFPEITAESLAGPDGTTCVSIHYKNGAVEIVVNSIIGIPFTPDEATSFGEAMIGAAKLAAAQTPAKPKSKKK